MSLFVVNLFGVSDIDYFFYLQVLSKLAGLVKVQSAKMTKGNEEVTVAVFGDHESAMQALQVKLTHVALSIPRNNHAKFILTML